jgi:hypothetical protein
MTPGRIVFMTSGQNLGPMLAAKWPRIQQKRTITATLADELADQA